MVSSTSSRGSTRSKKRSKRKGVQKAAVVHTSLPPQVDGQIRCFLVLKISKLSWKLSEPPALPILRVKWWGELTDGTVLSPAQRRVCARYAVRSGPKQFAEYLTDMGTLVMEVVDGSNMAIFGKVQVYGLNALTADQPIVGPYPIFSPKAEILGHVTVNISIQSLNVFEDSSSTAVPTTDLDTSDARSLPLKRSQREALRSLDESRDVALRLQSANAVNQTAAASTRKFPASRTKRELEGTRQAMQTAMVTPAKGDLVSLLLERGERLKAAMTSDFTTDHSPMEAMVPRDFSEASNRGQAALLSRELNGWAINAQLRQQAAPAGYYQSLAAAPKQSTPEKEDDGLDRTVGLLFGDDMVAKADVLPHMQFHLSDDDGSMSDDFALDESNDSDPLHNEELIEELFYGKRSTMDIFGTSSATDLSVLTTSVAGGQSVERSTRNGPDAAVSAVSGPSKVDRTAVKPSEQKLSGAVLDQASMGQLKGAERHHKASGPSKWSYSASASDSDIDRSDNASRVSFDLMPSEDEEESTLAAAMPSSSAPGLDAQQLTLLGQVKVARVCVDSFALRPVAQPDDCQRPSAAPASRRTATNQPRSSSAGKPAHGKPPAAPSTARGPHGSGSSSGSTYFIEYRFPVVAASRDSTEANAMATETVRAVSKKWDADTSGTGDFTFGSHSVFPVFFDGEAVHKWWSSALVFKVFCRPPGEKMVLPFGTASLPMRSILQSTSFSFSGMLDVYSDTATNEQSGGATTAAVKKSTANVKGIHRGSHRHGRDVSSGRGRIGTLKVRIELTSDSPSFVSALKEYVQKQEQAAAVAELMRPDIPIDRDRVRERTKTGMRRKADSGEGTDLPVPLVVKMDTLPRQEIVQAIGDHTKVKLSTEADIAVHILLNISSGRGFDDLCEGTQNGSVTTGLNLYVVCRGFWDEADSLISQVCWNSASPTFSLLETIPLFISDDILQRMKNNFMIIEVWLKRKVLNPSDELVGLVKVPLNILYASFRDGRIAQLLLKSEYPVICVDNYMPVTCPYSGKHRGDLHVFLAAGSRDQISDVQAARSCRETPIVLTASMGPLHDCKTDREFIPPAATSGSAMTPMPSYAAEIEHVYELIVNEIRSFAPTEDMLWGEADCFVQYHFPIQERGNLLMKTFRTDTVLCVPNPVFGHKTVHSFLLPSPGHIQAALLKAAGSAAPGSCVPFEVWGRFYHPNVRDQLLARGRLPLAKLCAMATMQQAATDSSAQASFSVPLSHADGSGKVGSTGLLDISVTYRRMHRSHGSRPTNGGIGSASEFVAQHGMTSVTLRLFVHRACGLQSATRALARKHKAMDYFAQVGPNTFVKVAMANISLSAQDFRVSPTIARNFCPEFLFYVDFQCPVVTDSGTCLVELLESAQAVLEVWHQAEHGDVFGGQDIEVDVLLGVAVVPLRNLVTHKTGVSNWFPITAPLGTVSISDDPLFGGLEVEVKFANSFDRQIMIDAAHKVGWSIPKDAVDNIVATGTPSPSHNKITIDVSAIRMSADIVTQLPEMESSLVATSSKVACYIKFTFYDAETFFSEPLHLEKDGQIIYSRKKVTEQYTRLVTPPLLWYLHENLLEIQLWLTYGGETGCDFGHESACQFTPPYVTDRYLGSAYIDLAPLAASENAVVSDVYPAYNRGSARAGQSSLEIHVSRTSSEDENTKQLQQPEKCKEGKASEQDECTNLSDEEAAVGNLSQNRLKLRVIIDQALHLKLWCGDGSVFVTFTWNARERKTKSEKPTDGCVQWLHESIVSLLQDQLPEIKDLVFKVWQETATGPRVLGFVSVDLMPLLHGMPELAGWYNIMDFSSLCQGQIKIGISPQSPLVAYRPDTGVASSMSNTNTSGVDRSLHSVPFTYRTSAVYDRFPVHIAHFTEQQIQAKLYEPQHDELPLLHHDEHVSGVRRHHRTLRSAAASTHQQPSGNTGRHHDTLQSKLRESLRELDDLTSAMRKRLHSRGLVRGERSSTTALPQPDPAAFAVQPGGESEAVPHVQPTGELRVPLASDRRDVEAAAPLADSDSEEEQGRRLRPLHGAANAQRYYHSTAAAVETDPEDPCDDDDHVCEEDERAYVRVLNERPLLLEAGLHADVATQRSQSSERSGSDDRSELVAAGASLAGAVLIGEQAASGSGPKLLGLPSWHDRAEPAGPTFGDIEEGVHSAPCSDLDAEATESELPEASTPDRDHDSFFMGDSQTEVWSPDINVAAYINGKSLELAEVRHTEPEASVHDEAHGWSGAARATASPQSLEKPVAERTDADHGDDAGDVADDHRTSVWNGSQTNLAELTLTESSDQRADHDTRGCTEREVPDNASARCSHMHRHEDECSGQQRATCDLGTEAAAESSPDAVDPNAASLSKPPTAAAAATAWSSRPLTEARQASKASHDLRRGASPSLPTHSMEDSAETTAADLGQLTQPLSSRADVVSAVQASNSAAAAAAAAVHKGHEALAPAAAAAAPDHHESSRRPPANGTQQRTTPEGVRFFPSAVELESSMRAVRLASAVSAAMQRVDRAAAESTVVSKFPKKPAPLALAVGAAPTAETARRLARIFSTRFTASDSS